MLIPDVRSSVQIVPKMEKAQPVGHAFYFTLYLQNIKLEGVGGQISGLYIWNAVIELEGVCKFYPLDKIVPKWDGQEYKSPLGAPLIGSYCLLSCCGDTAFLTIRRTCWVRPGSSLRDLNSIWLHTQRRGAGLRWLVPAGLWLGQRGAVSVRRSVNPLIAESMVSGHTRHRTG
jgi:hypothetical protein